MSSRNYYESSRQTLPPLRSVLGDALDLPVDQSRHTHHRTIHSSSGNNHLASHAHPHYGPPPTAPSSNTRPPSSQSAPKKHVCTWPGCGKRFERQNALDTHMNIHTDSKPFTCPVPACGKTFNVRSNMRRHLFTHRESDLVGIDVEGGLKRSSHPGHGGSGTSGEGYSDDEDTYHLSATQPRGYYYPTSGPGAVAGSSHRHSGFGTGSATRGSHNPGSGSYGFGSGSGHQSSGAGPSAAYYSSSRR